MVLSGQTSGKEVNPLEKGSRYIFLSAPRGEAQVGKQGNSKSEWTSPQLACTTHQAFSVWKTGWYHVARGEDVIVALVPGAMAQFEDQFAADGNADGVVRAGVGKNAFMLCPEGALAAFEPPPAWAARSVRTTQV